VDKLWTAMRPLPFSSPHFFFFSEFTPGKDFMRSPSDAPGCQWYAFGEFPGSLHPVDGRFGQPGQFDHFLDVYKYNLIKILMFKFRITHYYSLSEDLKPIKQLDAVLLHVFTANLFWFYFRWSQATSAVFCRR
jgi:hypothetical protein